MQRKVTMEIRIVVVCGFYRENGQHSLSINESNYHGTRTAVSGQMQSREVIFKEQKVSGKIV